MGYYEALRGRAQKIESKSLGKKAAKKGLWGSVGRTLGGLAATALTGGAATPWAVGLMAGGGSLLGGAIGGGAGGNLAKDSVWFKDEAEKLQGELGAFGSKNISESLKGAVTAGIGQKLKLVKDAKAAKLVDPTMSKEAVKALERGKGLDFAESMVGRAWEKGAPTRQLAKVRSLQVGEGLVPSLGDTTGVGTGKLPTGKSDIPSLFDMYENELNIEQARSSVSPAIEDTFSTSNNYPLVDKDFGFTEFDEPSWAEGKRKLSNIDYDILNKQINWQDSVFSPSESSSSLLRRPGGLNPRY